MGLRWRKTRNPASVEDDDAFYTVLQYVFLYGAIESSGESVLE